MYAVIASGGKQERVEVGSVVDVEMLGAPAGKDVTFAPVLVVDGSTVLAEPKALASVTVSGRVVGEASGPKITGFTYKPKSRSRRRFGHRQHYTKVEITAIETKSAKAPARARAEKA